MSHKHLRRLPLLAALILALAATALTGCRTTVSSAPVPNTVTASGSGTVQAAPDEAKMTFGITKTSPNAKTLLADTNKAAEKIVAALKKAGVEEKDIQTQSVNFFPQSTFANGKTKITGYEASISVIATVRDLTTLGEIITAGNDAGANNVSGPSFDISEDSPFTAQAIEKAVADARRNAEAMAKAADKTVGDVLSISDATVTPVQPFASERAFAGASAADAAKVGINPGQLDVDSSVVVIFELK